MHGRNASYGGFSSYSRGSGVGFVGRTQSGLAHARRAFEGDEGDDIESIEGGGSGVQSFAAQGWAKTGGGGFDGRKFD